jgi:hypothetical protein
MLAHREAGLATPNDQHLHSFVRHPRPRSQSKYRFGLEILRDAVGPFNT